MATFTRGIIVARAAVTAIISSRGPMARLVGKDDHPRISWHRVGVANMFAIGFDGLAALRRKRNVAWAGLNDEGAALFD